MNVVVGFRTETQFPSGFVDRDRTRLADAVVVLAVSGDLLGVWCPAAVNVVLPGPEDRPASSAGRDEPAHVSLSARVIAY